ncbi:MULTISPECIES: hypothetical protein [unclassified Nocardiopsis]|uniref:hypothetical protein n=1 Tax=unclassified Nocardiopsis TaxID=2649073 RepID=UPI00135AC551|nr:MULTISPECIES: hypothetical protein [unclassified Nocardiopsis]
MTGAAGRYRRPSPLFSVVLLLLTALVGHVALAGLDQGLRAARGEGVPGVFTATSLTCVQHPGHESCACEGRFTAEGARRAREVSLHAAGRDTCVVGAPVPAVDAGASNRVYGPDGSREWLVCLLVLAACLAVVAAVAAPWARHLRRRCQE